MELIYLLVFIIILVVEAVLKYEYNMLDVAGIMNLME